MKGRETLMDKLNELLSDLGISKVRLAKYLGVSRQMLYNYLALKDLNEWPNEKATKLFSLLDVANEKEFSKIKIDGNYIMDVETRLNEGVKDASEREVLTDLKGFNKCSCQPHQPQSDLSDQSDSSDTPKNSLTC